MKKIQYFIWTLILSLGIFTSCDILEPEGEDVYDMDIIKANVAYAEGFLCNAYRNLASTHTSFSLSYGSDDALTNQLSSNIKTAVSGGWTSNSNPFSQWNTSYESIMYINTFMEIMDEVVWDEKYPVMDSLYRVKLKGEAHGLRAWNYFHLLQAHAGKSEDGTMLGVPIVDHVLDQNDPEDYQVERSSFEDLVEFIIADCDSAIKMLPRRWVEQADPYDNIVVGDRNNNRINGDMAMFIKTKTLLYAASPAYADGGDYSYQMAATNAAILMATSGGLTDVTAANNDHLSFYSDPDVTNNGNLDPEVIWYGAKNDELNSWESTNYPPSLYGEGRTNPSQNLVDAFPMLDGSPVPLVKLFSNDPYSGRDPRLDLYIMRHGSVVPGVYDNIVITTTDGSQDALGSTDEYATQTGYYLRKFMNTSNVDLDPVKETEGLHYYIHARYTDVLLMFAEAANEAVGPDVALGPYTARQVINAIRDRAGITSSDYVNGLDQAGMRDLIRNERRIELCFEKQRFWDLRRWNDVEKLNEDVKGVRVSADGMIYSYEVVEERSFEDHQIYGPIPYSETLKYELIQNANY